MSIKSFRYFLKGIELRGETTDPTDNVSGSLWSNSTDNRLRTYIQGAVRNIITDTQTQTLTNKTLSGNEASNFTNAGSTVTLPVATDTLVGKATTDTLTNKTIDANGTGNSISNLETADLASGVLNISSTLASASDTQVPSALAVKTYADSVTTALDAHINDATDAHDASAISNVPSGNLAATNAQDAFNELQTDVDTRTTTTTFNAHVSDTTTHGTTGDIVGTSDTQVLTNKTIDADLNTITNIENADIKTGAAIARAKLASGTANAVLHNDASGVMTNSSDLLVATNALTLANTKHLEIQAATDSTTTGTSASLASFTAGAIRLTNASLASLANIPAGTNGQELVVFNRVGADVQIFDSSAALGTAANRILTGTNATITFSNNGALVLQYDATTARWQIIGGTGSGAGGSSSLDTIFQLTATEQLTEWSTGDNATFLGGGTISGTFAKETTTPLHGAASYKFTQAAGSLNDYMASAAQPVDLRFRGQQVYLTFPYQYDGVTGDIQAIVYDATNSAIITTTADVVQGTNASTQSLVVSCIIPLTCTNVRVGFHVKVLNSGKIFSFDDIALSTSLLQSAQLNNVTDWQAASFSTLAWQGLGTVTNTSLQCRRNGPNLEMRGSVTLGTTAASLAQFMLPVNFGSITTATSSATDNYGTLIRNAAATSIYYNAIATSGLGYFSSSSSLIAVGNNPSTPINGNAYNTGDVVTFTNIVIPIKGWSAGSTAIVTPTQQISSDTIAFAFKATAIVDSDPVGTFNTYTYAINTNTATISGSAPTQTVASMNTNGVQVFARAFNAASTTASPTRFDIKIGKNLKAEEVNAYSGLAKTTPISFNFSGFTSTVEGGTQYSYNEITGVLTLNAGLSVNSSTSRYVGIDIASGAGPTNAYFVFNASTTPSIAALPILAPRIATLSDVKASGTAGGSAAATTTQTRTLNTLVDSTGIVTSLVSNQFILQRGKYYIDASAPALKTSTHKARIRNITDSTTTLIGQSALSDTGDACTNISVVNGEFTITSAKTFELQHYTTAARATDGLGFPVTSGESETYAVVKITKLSDL